MAARIIKLRLRFERPSEFFGLSISVVVHVVAFALMLGVFSCGTPSPLPGPSMAVTLTGASISAKGNERTRATRAPQRLEPKAEEPKPKPEKPVVTPKEKPAAPTPKPTPSRSTTRVADPSPEPATPSTNTATRPHEPEPAQTDESTLPEGPIAGGVVGLDAISQLSPGYAGSVAQRLQSAWTDRPVLPSGASAQRAVIRFRILRDGRIEAIELSQESEFTLLNQSVLRLMRSVGRLPAFPPSIKRDSIDAEFVFELLPAEP
ncbi:MAG: TonB C-terminal domain-containing protein [Acidobacteriota bacterium]